MAHRLIWSTRAKADIHDIAKYIERDSKANADKTVKRLTGAIRRLSIFPLSGRSVPEWKNPAYREIIVDPYRVIYRVDPDTVAIAAIIHARQLFPRRPPAVRF